MNTLVKNALILTFLFWSLLAGKALACDSTNYSLAKDTLIQSILTTQADQNKVLIQHIEELSSKRNIEIWLPALIGFLAIFFAFIGTYWQTKGNSVSSFRVKWIDDLRTSYSEFYVSSQNVGLKQRENRLKISEDTDLDKMRFLQNKIKLLLNHEERDHQEFWNTFLLFIEKTKMLYTSQGDTLIVEQELNDLKLQCEEKLLVIFKKEWEKAKKFR